MNSFPSRYKDDSGQSTGLLFMRVYQKWHGEIKRRLREIGITHPQFVVLTTAGYLLQREEEVTQVMIAAQAGMDVMSISQILVLLEKKGWVRRREHSKDTRANAISLTEAGHKKMVAALPVVEEIDAVLFSSLGAQSEEFRALLTALGHFSFPQPETAS